ncbi:hypothetical protein ACM9HO_10110 [Pseudomonas sp. KHB2.9]
MAWRIYHHSHTVVGDEHWSCPIILRIAGKGIIEDKCAAIPRHIAARING